MRGRVSHPTGRFERPKTHSPGFAGAACYIALHGGPGRRARSATAGLASGRSHGLVCSSMRSPDISGERENNPCFGARIALMAHGQPNPSTVGFCRGKKRKRFIERMDIGRCFPGKPDSGHCRKGTRQLRKGDQTGQYEARLVRSGGGQKEAPDVVGSYADDREIAGRFFSPKITVSGLAGAVACSKWQAIEAMFATFSPVSRHSRLIGC